MSLLAFLAAAVLLAADRLLHSNRTRAVRGRLLARVSGITMMCLGAGLAFARRGD